MATYANCPMDWAVGAAVFCHPCPGRVRVVLAPPLQPDGLASTVRASCRITLSDQASWPWSQLCPVLVHEYGHLAGYRDPLNAGDPYHSHDPDDIMYAFIHPDRRCKHYGTPYLGHALPADAGPRRAKRKRAAKRKRGGRAAAPRSTAGSQLEPAT